MRLSWSSETSVPMICHNREQDADIELLTSPFIVGRNGCAEGGGRVVVG